MMGVLNDVGNTINNAANTVGNIIQDPGAAIDAAGNAVGNVLNDPDGSFKNAVNYMANNPERTALAAATMMKKGGKVSSASKRADGIAQRGKTRGRIV